MEYEICWKAGLVLSGIKSGRLGTVWKGDWAMRALAAVRLSLPIMLSER